MIYKRKKTQGREFKMAECSKNFNTDLTIMCRLFHSCMNGG